MTDLFTAEQLAAAREAWKLTVPTHRFCLCGELWRVETIATEDRFGLPLKTDKCGACGTLHSAATVAPEHLRHFYRDLYPVMHPGLGVDREAREMRQAHWLTHEHLVAPTRIVEIGGRCARYCMMAAEYCSIDIADEGRAPTFEADILVAFHVLEHCVDPVGALRGWSTLLAPDGRMVVAVPDTLEVHHHRYVKAMGFRGWLHLAHVFGWTEANVALPFIKAGLRVLSAKKAAPGTIATVGSIVVEARNFGDAAGEYIEGWRK